MNANKVMNMKDIVSHEIIPFITTPKPKSCDGCNKTTLDLHLYKEFHTKIFYKHPSLPLPEPVFSLPDELRNNEDAIADIEIFAEDKITNDWICSECFCKKLPKVWHHLQLDNDFKEHLKKENPEWDEAKMKKNARKEAKLIVDDKLLFKKHRSKKTQQKAENTEKWIYDKLRKKMAFDKAESKRKVQFHKDKLVADFEEKRKYQRHLQSVAFDKELRITLLAKWLTEKKIPYPMFAFISAQRFNYHTLPTWEQMARDYENHAQYENHLKPRSCPPVPAWFKDL
jgi:hypothetical protein